MDRLIGAGSRILPLFALLAAGYFFKRRSLVSRDVVAGIKALVANLTLPAVVFGAFSSVRLDRVTGVTFVAIFLACALALGVALALESLRPSRSPRPFLMTAFEAGMLGLPLFGLLYGAGNIPRIAMADLGEICFTFLILIPLMSSQDGERVSLSANLRRLARNPVIWAVCLGLAGSAVGAARFFAETAGGRAIAGCVSFVGAPTGALILFAVGYDLDFSPANLRAAVPTIGLRFALMVPLLFAARALVLRFGGPGVDAVLIAAITVLFLMPPSFAIPVFSRGRAGSEFIATTISLNTLVSVILLSTLAI